MSSTAEVDDLLDSMCLDMLYAVGAAGNVERRLLGKEFEPAPPTLRELGTWSKAQGVRLQIRYLREILEHLDEKLREEVP